MELEEVPAGFGTALAKNEEAMNAFAMMTKADKQAVWARARQVRSKTEMEQLVAGLTGE